MSDFDKYVAQWVSRTGDSLSKEVREQLLTNIHNSLDDYEALRNPAAAKARKEAAEKSKQREEEKKRKEEARKLQEEQDRRRQERQANLPPLPPSRSNTERAGNAAAAAAADPAPAAAAAAATSASPAKPKRKTSTKKSTAATVATATAGGADAARSSHAQSITGTDSLSQNNDVRDTGLVGTSSPRKSRTSQKIPYSKQSTSSRTTKQRQAGPVPVKDIDFKFGERVNKLLRTLEAEQPAAKPATATRKTVTLSPIVQTKGSFSAAAVPAPVPSHADPSTEPSAAAPKVGRNRSSPPPLDQVVAEDAECKGSELTEKTTATENTEVAEQDAAPSLHDNHDNRVDRSNSSSSCAASSESTKDYQDRLNEFHFASVGADQNGHAHHAHDDDDHDDDDDDVVDDAEEEFIDDREDMRRRTMQMQRPSRPAISDSTLDIDEARISNFPTTPKSQNKVKTISRVLVRHFLFSTLDDSDIAKFASIMDLEKFEAGENILTKGEPNNTFYIVLDGEAETTEANDVGEEVVVPLVRGSTCGDIALMYEVRNEANVVARSEVQCASLERRTYKMITSRAMEEKRKNYIDFLSSLSLFSGLSPYELERAAETLKEDSYVEGQKIIAYGVPNHWLHIVMEGTLRVAVPDADGGEGERDVALVHRGEFVGEIEFIYHHLPVASVYAASPAVKTAKLSRRSFEMLPSEVREKLVHLVEDDETYTAYHNRMRSASPPALDMTPPFDAPPASVQKSLHQYESEQSDRTSAATGTPPPQSIGSRPSA
jgi:CRP-like cAMP-binding protein